MCGIYFYHSNKSFQSDQIIKTMQHRGPDAFGELKIDQNLFRHYRLKILDLRDIANQPYSLDEENYLIFNGEIFNYQALAHEFLQEFTLKTTSDTEVLFLLLRKYGVSILNKLNGMFSFLYFNKVKNSILCVRDRYGIKPLYYSLQDKVFQVASEQKEIYANLKIKNLNTEGLKEFFSYKYIYGMKTLVQNIFELMPGHYFETTLDSIRIEQQKWYKMPECIEKVYQPQLQDIEELLTNAIQLRLISDVPVGLQLSGGVDSSLIAYYAKQIQKEKFKSYCISFPGFSESEGVYAQDVAKSLELEHYDIPFTSDDFIESWEKAVFYNDAPINHPHTLPIMKLTKIAKQEVTVLLSGEGADEVFMGYEHYLNHYKNLHPEKIINQFCFLPHDTVDAVLINGLHGASFYGERMQFFDFFNSENALGRYGILTHLKTLLERIDKMSMSNALEVRTPFLDFRLVEMGLKCSYDFLIQNQITKVPLKKLYEKIYKNNLSQRKKIGFKTPFDHWLLQEEKFQKFVLERVSNLKTSELFQRAAIDSLVNKIHNKQISGEQFRLAWVLTNFSIWKNAFALS